MKKYFRINNLKLPINKKKYLLDILSPTSKGTKYYDPIPNTKISEVQIGRVLLQCHQVVSLLKSLDIDLKNKTMIDVGTGNGLVPKILLKITQLKAAVGTDPFLDGEHKTSWQKHDRSHASLMIDKILKRSKYKLDINLYKTSEMLGNCFKASLKAASSFGRTLEHAILDATLSISIIGSRV